MTALAGVCYFCDPSANAWKAPGRPDLPMGPLAAEPPQAGALPLGGAAYPIPTATTVIYLALDGNDSNAGTSISAPKATLQAAISACPPLGTVVVRGGPPTAPHVYEQKVTGDVTKAIFIQNYPGEAVWFDGSSVRSTWTNNGDGTWSAPIFAEFYKPDASTTAGAAAYARYQNANSPRGLWADGVWVDGVRLWHTDQVPSGNQFRVDDTTNRVTIGVNPAGKEVRLTARDRWMVVKAPMVIRGIGIRRYADSNNTGGVITTVQESGGSLQENLHIVDAAFNATNINGTGSTIRHCTIVRAGYLGIGSNRIWDSLVENNLVLDANWKRMNFAPASGSIKLVRSIRGIARNNIMDSPNAIGVWYDVSCYDNWCYNNTASGAMGFFYEISRRAVFFNNRTLSLNPGKPLEICDSSEVRAYNNDFTRGTLYDIWIHTDNRRGVVTSGENPDGVQNWDCISPAGVGSEIVNNLLQNRNGYSGTWRVYMQGEDPAPADDYLDAFRSNVISTQTASSSTGSISRMFAMDRASGGNPAIYTSVTSVESTFPGIAALNIATQKQTFTAADVAGWQGNASVIPDDICDKVGIPRGTAAIGPVLPAPVPRTPEYV